MKKVFAKNQNMAAILNKYQIKIWQLSKIAGLHARTSKFFVQVFIQLQAAQDLLSYIYSM